MQTNLVMIGTAAVVVTFTLRPRLIRAPMWRATVTPLASIIGSGFLVAGPILSHTAGNWAWAAMLALCVIGYLFGAAIRRNIIFVEPLLESQDSRTITVLERGSDFTLAFAYFVSVTYYLNLLASFALRAGDMIDHTLTRLISSAIIIVLGTVGAIRGLHALENIEEGAVGIKLGLIAGLLAGLALSMAISVSSGTFVLADLSPPTRVEEIGVLLGLIILVQGFETSRYLGAAYDRQMRVKTMRYAQWLSSAIYLLFILLITPYFTGKLPAQGGETSIIDMLASLGAIVAPLIIIVAVASQLSAAVADMNGASGLLAGATTQRISVRAGYVAIAAVALAITWTASIYDIIVYASKAFVVYYALQCALATFVATRAGESRSLPYAVLFAVGVILSLLVLILGTPVDAG